MHLLLTGSVVDHTPHDHLAQCGMTAMNQPCVSITGPDVGQMSESQNEDKNKHKKKKNQSVLLYLNTNV